MYIVRILLYKMTRITEKKAKFLASLGVIIFSIGSQESPIEYDGSRYGKPTFYRRINNGWYQYYYTD